MSVNLTLPKKFNLVSNGAPTLIFVYTLHGLQNLLKTIASVGTKKNCFPLRKTTVAFRAYGGYKTMRFLILLPKEAVAETKIYSVLQTKFLLCPMKDRLCAVELIEVLMNEPGFLYFLHLLFLQGWMSAGKSQRKWRWWWLLVFCCFTSIFSLPELKVFEKVT